MALPFLVNFIDGFSAPKLQISSHDLLFLHLLDLWKCDETIKSEADKTLCITATRLWAHNSFGELSERGSWQKFWHRLSCVCHLNSANASLLSDSSVTILICHWEIMRHTHSLWIVCLYWYKNNHKNAKACVWISPWRARLQNRRARVYISSSHKLYIGAEKTQILCSYERRKSHTNA